MDRRRHERKSLRRRAVWTILGTCAAVVALGGVAQAETITLGPPLTGPMTNVTCAPAIGGGCGEMLLSSTSLPSVQIASPVDGTVVRWRMRGASSTLPYSLDVLRHNTDGSYTVTASTGPVTPAGNEVETLPTSLPIHVGEYIELNLPQGGQLTALEEPSTYSFFFPTLEPGETRQPGEFEYPFTFAYNADVDSEATPVVPAVPVLPTAPVAPISPAPIASPASPLPTKSLCIVPVLEGKKLSAAKRAVRAAGCGVGLIAKSGGTAGGRVIEQRPKPGRVLSLKTGISIKLG